MSRRSLIAALAAVGMIAAPAVAHAAPPGFYGVTPTSNPGAADLSRMAQARVGTLRVMFNWGEIQESQGGDYDFSETDVIVAQAAHRGIRVLPFLYGTPNWARNCSGVPTGLCDRVDPLASAAGQSEWPKFVRALVARYGPTGDLWSSDLLELILGVTPPPYLPITQWQVWNEPNSSIFFLPSPTAGAYHRLLASTAAAIKGVDPAAGIVLGGLFGTPARGQTMPEFLDKLYRINGAKSLIDAVAIHPYSPDLDGIVAQLELARQVLSKRKDKGARLMLTELGWGSGKKSGRGGRLYKGAKGQKQLLKSSFKFLTKKRKRYKIDGLFWFSWRDLAAGTAGQCLLCESFGLLDVNGNPKPSYGAFTRFTGGS